MNWSRPASWARSIITNSIRVNLGLFQHDVNVIWDLAVHDLSIIDYVLGMFPSAVSANGASPIPQSPESIAYLSLFYPSGTIAHVNVNWLAPVKVRQMLIGGSRKMIVFDDLEPSEKIKIYDKGVTISDDPSTDLPASRRLSHRRHVGAAARDHGGAAYGSGAFRRLHSHGVEACDRRPHGRQDRRIAGSGDGIAPPPRPAH